MFAYIVNNDEDTEASFGTAALRLECDPIDETKDGKTQKDVPTDEKRNQSGDRKTLPFKVKDVVTAGEIKIYSDKEMVVFHDKTFRITNAARNLRLTYYHVKRNEQGEIQYGADGNALMEESLIPADAFVSFELKENHNRIGVITMKEEVDVPEKDANSLLRLRSEYDYDWEGDDIIIRFQDDYDTVYTNEVEINRLNNLSTKDYFDLAYLFANPSVQLTVPPVEDNL